MDNSAATQALLRRLDRVGANPDSVDEPRADDAIGAYFRAVPMTPRPIEWCRATEAMARVQREVETLAADLDPTDKARVLALVRDPAVREAHVAARARSYPDGAVPSRLVGQLMRDARDTVRGIPRNQRWQALCGVHADTLGDDRFAVGNFQAAVAQAVDVGAVDAQLMAIEHVMWVELAEGRDPRQGELTAPLFEAFVAGAWRFWVLPDRVIVVPRGAA